jgi:membrane-bound lytic murein transglycosylase D
MESKPLRFAVAAGLFCGGLIVGGGHGATRENSAHAAEGPVEGPKVDGPPRPERGPESAALKKLRGGGRSTAEREDIEPMTSLKGARCASREPVSRDAMSRDRYFGQHSVDVDDDSPFAGLRMPSIAVAKHPRVLKYLRYFTESTEGRKFFTETHRRSGRYQEVIAQKLREQGLPEDLIALVYVESGFSPAAVSTAGAAGLWQFMPHTARAYGLAVESTYDERASIWHSTRAAAQHLADLHERFRSWDLALAAYNLGYEGLERRMDEFGTDDYWTLVDEPGAMPKETAHYVAKVLAIAVVLKNTELFGFDDIERAPPLDASELEVAPGTRLGTLARAAGTSVRALHELNPELLSDIVPNRGAPVLMHVPKSGLSRARVMLPRLAHDGADDADRVSADYDWGRDEGQHSRLEQTRNTVAHGRDPAQAARRFARFRARADELTTKAKQALRGRRDPQEAAERLERTGRADRDVRDNRDDRDDRARPEQEPVAAAAAPVKTQDRVFYRVAAGDSVRQIATTFGLTVDDLLKQAGVAAAEDLRVGTMLDLRVPKGALPKSGKPDDRDTP